MKKVINKIFSMKVALVILFLLIIACIGGSVITQDQIESYYSTTYPSTYHLIMGIGLDHVFSTIWFKILGGLLCVDLIGCNLINFPQIIKKTKNFTPANFVTTGEEDEKYSGDIEKLYQEMGFRNISTGERDGQTYYYSVKNKIGEWGAWLTHLGILLIIVGFALGQYGTKKYSVYGVPGQTKEIEGTKYSVRIDEFSTELRDDETVEQYTTNFTLINNETGEEKSGTTSVNHPCNLFGLKVYQNSTGWAADVVVYEDEEYLQDETLCAGEYLTVKDLEDLKILFKAFYPDLTYVDGEPESASSSLNNPGYLYMVYYGNDLLGMNVLNDDYISIDNYNVIFTNPQQYSLLQVKTTSNTWVIGLGAIEIMIALVIAFYFQSSELYAVKQKNTWLLYARSRKGSLLFKDKLHEKCRKVIG